MIRGFLIPVLCLTVLSACHRHSTIAKNTGPITKIDACNILHAEDIQEIQGAPVKDTKSSEQSNGQVRTSQCYFGTDPSNRSVSLSVIQTDPGNSDRDAVRNFWRSTFTPQGEKRTESEAEREKRESLREQKRGEEEENRPPMKKIDGVGEEAFWSGTRVGGALYVLQGSAYIRLSLGGPDTEQEKIEKSKRLALKILPRL